MGLNIISALTVRCVPIHAFVTAFEHQFFCSYVPCSSSGIKASSHSQTLLYCVQSQLRFQSTGSWPILRFTTYVMRIYPYCLGLIAICTATAIKNDSWVVQWHQMQHIIIRYHELLFLAASWNATSYGHPYALTICNIRRLMSLTSGLFRTTKTVSWRPFALSLCGFCQASAQIHIKGTWMRHWRRQYAFSF